MADGYIDLTEMPAAPNFPQNPTETAVPSAPITVTLQVHGIAGLSVQLTIPSLTPIGGGPVYTVSNGVLILNTNALGSGPLQFQFSQPVAGLGGIGTMAGRAANFSISTAPPDASPQSFSNGNNSDNPAPHYNSSALEQVALEGTFSLAVVTVTGGNFGYPSVANLRVQSTAAAAANANTVPTDGLAMWLKSESASSQFAGGAAIWPDQSGNGNNATQSNPANQPGQIEQDGNTCRGAFSFSQNQYFNFNLPIDGWQEMTIYLVAKSLVDPPAAAWAGSYAGLFWNQNGSWGNTYLTPYQQTIAFRFGTGQLQSQPFYRRPATIGQDFTVTHAVHQAFADSLYVDGQLVLMLPGRGAVINGTDGTGFIGHSSDNTGFVGEISEILVYNRALTTLESTAVDAYLRKKFGTR
jgi:hypothetical protein